MNATAALVEQYRVARSDPALVVLEGLHAVKHALRFGADFVHAATVDRGRLRELALHLCPELTEQILALAEPLELATFRALAQVAPNTGVIALARRPVTDGVAALAGKLEAPAVLLDDPSHPGNVGAAVRVAAAAGAAAFLVRGMLDPWRPASVRGGAGLQFALPTLRVDSVPASERPLVAVTAEGPPLTAGGLPPGALLAFGSERRGLSDELRAAAEHTVGIPMQPGVSSLNLATAVAVTLYVGYAAAARE